MATGGDEEMPESTFPAHEEALHAERGRDSDDQDSTDLEPAVKGDLPSRVTAPTVTFTKQEPVTESQPTTEIETYAEPFFGPMEDMDPSQWVNSLSHKSSSMMIHLLTTILEGENTKCELIDKLQADMLILYLHCSSHYGVGSADSQSQAELSDGDWESLELERPFVQLELIVRGLTCVNGGLATFAEEVISSCAQVAEELETLANCREPDTDSDRGECQPTTGLDRYLAAMNLDTLVRMKVSISRFSSPVKSLFNKVLEKHTEINSKLIEMVKLNSEFLSAFTDHLEDFCDTAGGDSDADDESSLSDTNEE